VLLTLLTRAWRGLVLLAGVLSCRWDTRSGSFSGPVAWPVHEDLVAVVDEPVERGLGDDAVGEERVPIRRRPVRGQDE
jgi:hypothetical protein